MKKCPFCGADIEDNARFCLYCMQSLVEKEQIILHQKKKPQWFPIIAAIVAILLIFAFVFFPEPTTPETEPSSDDPQLNSTTSSIQTEPSDTQPVTEPSHIHSYSEKNTSAKYQKQAPTCTSLAVYYYSCLCGEKGSETFSHGVLAEHIVVTDPGYPADCVKTGLSDGSHCSVCNIVFLVQTPIPVISHTYSDDRDDSCNVCNYIRVLNCNHKNTIKLPAVAPTCIANGLTEGKTCTLCGKILTEQSTLLPLGHTEVIDHAIAPTCTTTGKTEGKHCSTCNTVLSPQVTLSTKEHMEVIDKAIAPTCTADGKTEGKHCSVCNTVLLPQVAISAKGHTEVVDKAIAPTCTVGGKAEGKHCSVCNTVLLPQVAISAKGHTEVIDKAIAPTCTVDGKTEGKHCSVCQVILVPQQSLPAGHSFSTEDLGAPCSRCGAPSSHTHNYSAVVIADEYLKTKSTCMSAAVYYYSCACGKKGSSTFSWGDNGSHTIVTDPAVKPTCDTPGVSEGSHCSVCKLVIKEQFEQLATGHIFRLGNYPSSCLVCGATETLAFQMPELPFCYNDTYRIDSGKYRAHKLDDGNWRIVFSFTYTNISSSTVTGCGPTVQMSNSIGHTPPGPITLQPNQSAIFEHAFFVHFNTFISNNTYKLVFT